MTFISSTYMSTLVLFFNLRDDPRLDMKLQEHLIFADKSCVEHLTKCKNVLTSLSHVSEIHKPHISKVVEVAMC